jgi:hypothetical protein
MIFPPVPIFRWFPFPGMSVVFFFFHDLSGDQSAHLPAPPHHGSPFVKGGVLTEKQQRNLKVSATRIFPPHPNPLPSGERGEGNLKKGDRLVTILPHILPQNMSDQFKKVKNKRSM